jgi:deoxycytidine triphosphate deaminase
MFEFDLQCFADQAPVQGFDVSISVMGPNGPQFVGEYQEMEFKIQDEDEEYWLTGRRTAMLLDGDIKITGKLKRGWIDLDLITQIYGQSSIRRDSYLTSARFTITATIDATFKGLIGRIALEDCKFNEINIAIKAGKGVVNHDMSFRAEGIAEA